MSWKISSILFALLLFACSQEERPFATTADVSYLMEADELLSISGHPNIRLIDLSAKKVYEDEHIEGSVNMSRSDMEDRSYPYGGMMASKAQIEFRPSQGRQTNLRLAKPMVESSSCSVWFSGW